MEKFSDFIWHRLDGPPPTEAEMQSVGNWLISADHTGGLARIIWHNCDHNTLDMVLHMSGLQYANIPVAIIEAVPLDMNAYILVHLANPNDLAHKFMDVTEDEFKGTGLDAYDAWSPGEGDDEEGKEKVPETESDLLNLMTASIPIGDRRAKNSPLVRPTGNSTATDALLQDCPAILGKQKDGIMAGCLEIPYCLQGKTP